MFRNNTETEKNNAKSEIIVSGAQTLFLWVLVAEGVFRKAWGGSLQLTKDFAADGCLLGNGEQQSCLTLSLTCCHPFLAWGRLKASDFLLELVLGADTQQKQMSRWDAFCEETLVAHSIFFGFVCGRTGARSCVLHHWLKDCPQGGHVSV